MYDVIKMHVFVGMFIHRKESFNILRSLTKSIRHKNACPRRGIHTQERNFNIPVFLHPINVRKRVKIIPHLCEHEMDENV